MKALLIMSLVLLPITCWAGASALADQPRLVVQGDASLQVPADQAYFNVGVSNESTDADEALRENSQAMLKVEKALIQAGLDKGDYNTGQFQLRPRWSSRPRSASGDWRPEIVGYSVQNSFSISTLKLDRIGVLIKAARKAGANEIGQIRFGLSEPRKYRKRAIDRAVANGRADAVSAAVAAGARLGEIKLITLGSAGGPPVRPLAGAAMVRSMAAESAPPIVAPDDLQVRASVTLEFTLVPTEGMSTESATGQ